MAKLVAMSESEYQAWKARSVQNYAADKKISDDLSQEEAVALAQKSFERLLPEGLNTKDQFLFCVKDDAQQILGHLWFGLMGKEGRRKAFVYDIIVEEKWRGKGWGKWTMQAFEEEARKHKVVSLGLHVFAHNPTAVGLYQSLGYKTTDLVMAKEL